ncbi:membrane bound O-acyl transferase family-domain-containing protein [Xylariaceae sp. FL0662B]|nr:membrane bound O-acyl transferase family-domain-containing protein [Xylariaceae sp. FL0662B]
MPLPISFSLDPLKPGLLFVAAVALTTLALHFPPRHHSLFLFPTWFLTVWALASINDDGASWGPIGLDSYTVITCIIYILILPNILVIEKRSLLDHIDRTSKTKERHDTVISPSRSSISAACRVWNNPRHLSFQQSVPGSTPWPTMLRFTLYRGLKAVSIIIVDRLIVQKIRERLTATSTVFDFTSDQEPILRRLLEWDDDPITYHQLLLRAFMSLSWVWANVLILESYHAVLAVVFVVILRFDNPDDWPPLFGSPAEAWTVRRFWGKFWHRIASPSFASWSRLVSRRLLRCQPRSWLDKAVIAFGIFFLSGVTHAIAAWRVGQGDADRDLLFFCANFVVVGFELLISKIFRLAARRMRHEALLKDHRVQMFGKALGFVWVFAWFFWLAPRWLYPKTLRWSLKQALMQSRF